MRTARIWQRGLAVAAALLAGVMPLAAQQLKPFKLGISAPVVTVLPSFIADAAKLFEKQGLKTEIISIEGGSRGVQVLLSGEIQAMSVGVAPVVLANIEGADIRTIASTANTIPISVVAQGKFKTGAELKGANIGISTFGSETDIAITLALKQFGLKREDVTISQVGGSSQRYGALLAGRIDAAPLLEPAITQAQQKGGFTVVADLAAAKIPWIFESIVVPAASIDANADNLQRFLKAYLEAIYVGLTNEKLAKDVIAAKWKTADPVVIDATYADFKRLMPLDLAPSLDGARNVIEQLSATGIQVKSRNVDDYVDTRLIKKLASDGYIAQLQATYQVK
jgi:NitT/TauT family transport system substrate-binding protein